MKKLTIALAALLASTAPSSAQQAQAPFVIQETGDGYTRLQDAVDAIGEGSGTILIAPGTYRQCAVQNAGSIAYVAQEFGTVTFDGVVCEDKAALVLDGRDARVEGLIFQNIRVNDRNGAGIRLEDGNLLVRETLFRNSEQGILTASNPQGSIRIEQSTFSGLGGCPEDAGCSHSLYIGDYGSLTVVRSRFERGTGGHYVKTRAPRVEITDSSFDDSRGRSTNYMIDLSNGATGLIARNTFVQGREKENYTALIMIAPEGAANSSDGLTIVDNDASVVPGVTRRSAFVYDGSGADIRVENNRLSPQLPRLQRR